jgi:FkbM family methyltransferase
MRAAEIRAAFAAVLAERKPEHLVHVGAHEGEEVPGYLAAGVERITLVEPIPELAGRLRTRYSADDRIAVVEAACSDVAGIAMLHIPARTNMATVELPSWDEGAVIEVEARRLDEIAPDADAAVIDVQGHEFAVLEAAPWASLQLIMVETCTIDDALSPRYEIMIDYMREGGFGVIAEYARDYDYIQRWAYGRRTSTGAEVRDVVFARD